ncbi:MAG TPA: hypothetical protein VLF59_03745 [Candidatus Saccharimonadales bacterium]|nr:hypothetical protein [Candidatus Saccharimonadales bacterium]
MSAEHPERARGLIALAETSTIAERFDQSRLVLEEWVDNPPADDMHISRYAKAMLPYQDRPGPIRDTMHVLLEQRTAMGASHLETLKLRALQVQFIALYGDAYPAALHTVDDWSEGIQTVLSTPDLLAGWLDDMRHRDLQSNDPNRGNSLKVFQSMAAELGRLATGHVLEIGASQGLIQKRLAWQALHGFGVSLPHFGHTDQDISLPHVIEPGSSRVGIGHTQAFRRYLDRAVPVGTLVCMDLKDPLESRDWTLTSLYPSEHEDSARKEYVRALAYTDFDNIRFYIGDFDALDPNAYHQDYPQAEIIFPSTCFYQSPPDVRARMTQKAIAMAGEFVFLQDNCVLDVQDPTQLIYPTDWQTVPYGYRSYVWDKRAQNPQWQEFAMSPNTRVNTVRMGAAEIVSDRSEDRGRSIRALDILMAAM